MGDCESAAPEQEGERRNGDQREWNARKVGLTGVAEGCEINACSRWTHAQGWESK